MTTRVLVTGGVRSGKSHHAESLVSEMNAAHVTYVAPGPTPDAESDPDWTDRVQRHRDRRPRHWTTRESADLASAVRESSGPVLVDCLGTWVTSLVDAAGLWDAPYAEVLGEIDGNVEGLLEALGAAPSPVVFVTNEVGLGVIPSHRSGRLFRDLLGTVNRRVAEHCDEVHLVVAGRVLVL